MKNFRIISLFALIIAVTINSVFINPTPSLLVFTAFLWIIVAVVMYVANQESK